MNPLNRFSKAMASTPHHKNGLGEYAFSKHPKTDRR